MEQQQSEWSEQEGDREEGRMQCNHSIVIDSAESSDHHSDQFASEKNECDGGMWLNMLKEGQY